LIDASAYDKAESDAGQGSSALANRSSGTAAGKRQLTGPQRAAVLLLALGEQHGAKIWSMLDDDELRQLSIVMSTIGTIEASWSRSCCSNSFRGCRRPAR